MKNARLFLPVLAAVAFVAIPAPAADKFVIDAAEGGMAEVQLAQLAQTKANSQAVKDLATRLYNDHNKANDTLKTIAGKDNVTWPTAMNVKAQREYNKLQALSGRDFDLEFVNYLIKDHKDDISLFQHEIDHGKNEEVKAWAAENLPVLREHLSMAEDALKQISK